MRGKDDYIKYRIAKSKEVFGDAKLLASNGSWNSCVNRLYYSSFYLISALLLKSGLKAETHKGIKTQFSLHFIKTDIIDLDFGKLYFKLFNWRQDNDYADFIEFDEIVVEPLIKQVEEFNQILTNLIIK